MDNDGAIQREGRPKAQERKLTPRRDKGFKDEDAIFSAFECLMLRLKSNTLKTGFSH